MSTKNKGVCTHPGCAAVAAKRLERWNAAERHIASSALLPENTATDIIL